MTTRPDIFAAARERRAAIDARISELAPIPGALAMLPRLPQRISKVYVVSPDPGGGTWRLSWFIDGVPCGHTLRADFAGVLRAADDYGADLLGARAVAPDTIDAVVAELSKPT